MQRTADSLLLIESPQQLGNSVGHFLLQYVRMHRPYRRTYAGAHGLQVNARVRSPSVSTDVISFVGFPTRATIHQCRPLPQ